MIIENRHPRRRPSSRSADRARLRRVPRRAGEGHRRGPVPGASASRSTWSRRPTSARTPTSPPTSACTPTVGSTCSSAPARTARASRPPPRSSWPRTSGSTTTTSPCARATPTARRSAPGTGGSRSGPMIGQAVTEASLLLREKVVAIAAHLLEASPDDLEVAEGVVSVKGTPTKSVPVQQVAWTAYQQSAHAAARARLARSRWCTAASRPTSMWSNAAHGAIVEVDPATGKVEILRYVVSEDCGRMINPNIVDGQVLRRRRPGHRRCALRAQRLRRRRQPAGVDVHGLPAAHGARDPRHRDVPHRVTGGDRRRVQGRR